MTVVEQPRADGPTGQPMAAGNLSVSVVLPCLDEAESVGPCVAEALAALAAAGITGEVVVVDNGSVDGSPEVASDAGARVVHETRRGYGAAILAGIVAARGEIVVMADADGTYPLDQVARLVGPVADGDADLAVGERLGAATMASMPFLHRFLGTPGLSFLVNQACGGRVVHDSQSGYRAFRRDVMLRLGLCASGMDFASEMIILAHHAGLRVVELDTGYRERSGGESKLHTFRDGWRHLRRILLLVPHLLLVAPGAALAVAGALGVGASMHRGTNAPAAVLASAALVCGVLAVLAGVVLAHWSPTLRVQARTLYPFVAARWFRRATVGAGAACVVSSAVVGMAASAATDPGRAAALAAVAPGLAGVGVALAGFAVVAQLLACRILEMTALEVDRLDVSVLAR